MILGGQHTPFWGGQHAPFWGGQLKPILGGQYERFFQYLGNKSKEESESRKINELSEVAREIFAKKSVLGYSELLNAVMEALDIKDRMARNYIKFMKDNGIIEKSNGISVEYSLPPGFS